MPDRAFRQLPHNVDAEGQLLGAWLNGAHLDLLARVHVDDFVFQPHRAIFRELSEGRNEGASPTFERLQRRLADSPALADVGGAGYLDTIRDSVELTAAAPEHAHELRECARLRDVLAIADAAHSGTLADVEARLRAWLAAGMNGAHFGTLASDIAPEAVRWVWPGRFPSAKVSLLVGDPEASKTTLALFMLATVTRGADWPDGMPCARGHGLVISAEDDAADTLVPRLIAAGADLDRVDIVDTADPLDALLPRIATWSKRHENPLVMVDPLGAFLGAANSWKDQDVRALMASARSVCAETGAALLGIAHLNKNAGANANAVYRVMGGLGFVAAARAVWGVFKDDNEPRRRLMLKVKNNLAPADVGGLAYAIDTSDDGQPIIRWESGTITMSADDALRSEAGIFAEREDAKEFLVEMLAGGPASVKDIKAAAEDAGHAWRTIERAKRDLGIKRRGMGFGLPFEWHAAHCGCMQCSSAE